MDIKNKPALWRDVLPKPSPAGHKYDRGHVIVLGGVAMTGAARLVAEASMRAGAGVCTIISDASTRPIYLSGAAHIMFEPYSTLADFPAQLADPRRNAVVMGPGAGRGEGDEDLRRAVIATLKTGKGVLLDADALTVFEGRSPALIDALHPACVLTPHEGEFARLFGEAGTDRVEKARAAAAQAGCVVVLKGPQTVIAGPDGPVVLNDHASPWLATAGAGDVLAGMIGGFLAQGHASSGKAGFGAFEAACAAVWIHGEIARRFGPGLTAPDIIAGMPAVLRTLYRDFA